MKEKSPEDILKDLGLRSTGRLGSYPQERNSAATLPNGRYLVCRWKYEFTEADLQRLSRGAEVVACFVEEHVMVSRAVEWRDGQEVWAVTHDTEIGHDHLDVRGAVPTEFAAIRDRLMAEQASEAKASSGVRIEKRPGVIRLTAGKRAPEQPAKSEASSSIVQEESGCDHLFDVPVETAASVTGFSHERALDGLAFEALGRVSLLQRMFGR